MHSSKHNTGNHLVLKRIGAGAVCLLLVLTLCFTLFGHSAQAAASLPYIEQLVSSLSASKSSFVILEIVPQNDLSDPAKIGGSIGYYIDGCEPFAGWAGALSSKSGSTDSQAAREAYMRTLFSNLQNAGIMGDNSTFPITLNSSYTEYYPWENVSGTSTLHLANAETLTVTGTFTPQDGGSYTSQWQYNLLASEITVDNDGVAADGNTYYVQDIDKFISVLDGAGNDNAAVSAEYYYSPSFVELNDLDDPVAMEIPDGTIVYEQITEDASGNALLNPYYEYVGTMGNGLELNSATQYWYVESTGTPTTERTGYAAISSSYSAATYAKSPSHTAYFSSDLTGYEFVGDGSGDTDFVPNNSGESRQITFSTVYYKCSYTNNNWFLKYVFDMDTSFDDINFIVNTVTPSSAYESMVNAADMIVLSAGLDRSNASLYRSSSGDDDIGNDLSDQTALAIYKRAYAGTSNSCPIIVDRTLASLINSAGEIDTNIAQLSRLLMSEIVSVDGSTAFDGLYASLTGGSWTEPIDNEYVNKNLYCIDSPIITSSFSSALSSDDRVGFEAVLAEIQNENFLRNTENSNLPEGSKLALLTEEVTRANIIRYIINYGGQRTSTIKDKITVLEIEPSTSTSALTKADVLGWLGGESSSFSEDDINIVTMSTYELIGKIESLTETYDLIYIGDSLTGLDTRTVSGTSISDYNDDDMDGLLYTNIGDTYTASLKLAGLLDSDFITVDGITGVNGLSFTTANIFRFSGNDLTEKKAQELKDFVSTGYPVILANGLVESSSAGSGSTFTFGVTVSEKSKTTNSVTLAAASTGIPSTLIAGTDYTISYKWYRYHYGYDTYLGDGSEYTVSNVTTWTSDNYYCVATLTIGNNDSQATSNYIKVYYSQDGKTITSFGSVNDSDFNYLYTTGGGGGGSTRYVSVTATPSTISSNFNSNQLNMSCSYDYVVTNRRGNQVSNGTVGSIYELPDNNYGDNCYAKYQWQQSANRTAWTSVGGNNATLSNPAVGYYYRCIITYYDDYNNAFFDTASTDTVYVSTTSGTAMSAVNGSGRTVTVTYTPTVSYDSDSTLRTDRVDSASYMYDAVNSIKGYSNVMTVSEVDGSNSSLLSYLSLSKPSIVWTDPKQDETDTSYSYPTEYAIDAGGNMTSLDETYRNADGKYELRYTFSIENETDPTPNVTTYDCRLFVDLNSDGLYSDEERITDIIVRDSSGKLISASSGTYALSAGSTYTVTRQMPSDYAGIIPWKLEVEKNIASGSSYVHASQTGYTRIAPTAGSLAQINILQIKSNEDSVLDLQQQQSTVNSTAGKNSALVSQLTSKDGTVYNGIYGKLIADIDDFDINITSVKISNVDSSAITYCGNNNLTFTATVEKSVAQQQIEAYLDSFDMLIIGFDDMYGTLSTNAANAVVTYISSGKSVLFAHDTTSYANLPDGDSTPVIYTNSGGTVYAYSNSWSGKSKVSVYGDTISWSGSGGTYLSFNGGNTELPIGNYVITATVQNTSGGTFEVGIEGGVASKQYEYIDAYSTDTISIPFTINSTQNSANAYFWSSSNTSATITGYRITSSPYGNIGSVSGPSYWGYSFNSLLRDAVYLDRYGVTSSKTLFPTGTTTVSDIVSSSYGLNSSYSANIIKNGYSIAYKAENDGTNSGKTTIDSRVQGYTSYGLLTFGTGTNTINCSGGRTTKISQVNEGQITTYPYDINTSTFSSTNTGIGASDTMSIGLTHEQYYQLNLNSDNIVVWYCLADDNDDGRSTDYQYNDVLNAYYIFSCGNVTYSGVGHTAGQSNYTIDRSSAIDEEFENEAKLFVNTMIAAYRTVVESPEVKFTDDSTGETATDFYFLTSDISSSSSSDTFILESFLNSSEETAVYFKLSDPNLNKEKTISARFYYTTDPSIFWDDESGAFMKYDSAHNANVAASPTLLSLSNLYFADTMRTATASNLTGGLVYKFFLPSEVISAIAPSDVSSVELFVVVETQVDGSTYLGCDSVEIRKIGLSNLR